ncbi:MAG: LysR family transcriptional regulator [Oscillospiraceae bacterium]|nr:LysR family transcriptional regulator [Oscillospiraceae bacterium]
MNIDHLRYVLEIAKTGTVKGASENLFISQPNLSRALKELETSVGIKLFKRTSKGMIPTHDGEEFLSYAEEICGKIDEVTAIYGKGSSQGRRFSVSVPRACYISAAFSEFIASLDKSFPFEIYYKETNSMRAINNILESDYKLGIIRFQDIFRHYFEELLENRDFTFREINRFSCVVIMSEDSPLAKKEILETRDLADYTEISHPDSFVPALSVSEMKKAELTAGVRKRIFVYERASELDLLSSLPDTFMWVSPAPAELLKRHCLIQRPCIDNSRVYLDYLIYKKSYRLSPLDKRFIEKVEDAKEYCF